MIYIGIDPGSSGGIAAVDLNGHRLRCVSMPPTEADILLELAGMVAGRGLADVRACIEGVHAFPKMGAVSAFTFGRGYGGLLMALTAAGIRFDIVTPRTWQGALSCLTGGDKNVSKRRAQQLFPGVLITHAIADALLIAYYCRERHHADIQIDRSLGNVNGDSNGEEEKGRHQTGKGQSSEGPRQQAGGRQAPRSRTAEPAAPRHGTGAQRKAR